MIINRGGGTTLPITTNLLKGDGSGGAAAAVPGTDYLTQHQSLAAYRTAAAQDIIDAEKGNIKTLYLYEDTLAEVKAKLENYTAAVVDTGDGKNIVLFADVLPTMVVLTTLADRTITNYLVTSSGWTSTYSVLISSGDYSPQSKTAGMTQPVGVDTVGELWTVPADLSSYRTAAAQDVIDGGKVDKVSGASSGHIAILNADGGISDSGHDLGEYVQYGSVSVAISATDGAVPVQGDGVSVQLYRDTDLIDTVEYNGQPVTFANLIPNATYKVQPVGAWAQHYRPTPASYTFKAMSGATTNVAIVYASMSIPETLQDLADIVQNGGAQNLTIGTQITIPWHDAAANVDYEVPVDIVSVQEIEDQNGQTHEAAIIQWHYTTPFTIQFDAAEGATATETTAEAGLYYYGKTGSTYTLLDLSAGDPIPYGDYDSVVKNSIKDTSYNIFKYGYNRYRDSAWRQFLTSEAGVGEWWAATHVGDNAPSQLSSRAGFLSGFSAEDLALMKPCKITCYTNSVTDGSVIDTMYDRWWLASGTEMYGSVNANEGTYFPYWKEATGLTSPSNGANTGRIAYSLTNHSSAQWHWLRSANRNSSCNPWSVTNSGLLSNGNYVAYNAGAALPVCAIY